MNKALVSSVLVGVFCVAGMPTLASETSQNSNNPAPKATLSGVSGNDLKLKPRPEQTTGKEPLKNMNENKSPTRLKGVTAQDLKMPPNQPPQPGGHIGKEPANTN